MYIIGKANKAEIKEMINLGFDVEKVNEKHFDKAMGDDGIVDSCDTDELVGIYLDCDILQECRSIIALEKLVSTVTGD